MEGLIEQSESTTHRSRRSRILAGRAAGQPCPHAGRTQLVRGSRPTITTTNPFEDDSRLVFWTGRGRGRADVSVEAGNRVRATKTTPTCGRVAARPRRRSSVRGTWTINASGFPVGCDRTHETKLHRAIEIHRLPSGRRLGARCCGQLKCCGGKPETHRPSTRARARIEDHPELACPLRISSAAPAAFTQEQLDNEGSAAPGPPRHRTINGRSATEYCGVRADESSAGTFIEVAGVD
jgi:hypothetical protein